ncbi:MAG: rod-binding protein [Lachnospiraceae bacterium]|nr:rod-binding protein [Lachnospiraceae bacterium]
MAISIGADYYLNNALTSQTAVKADKLSSALGSMDAAKATDEELMESCKEFEAYLVEQMLKGMEKTIPKDEDEEENPYLEQFGDVLYTQVSKTIVENGELGLARQLFESMKRNQGL